MNTLFIKKLFSNSSAKVKKDEEDIYTQIGNDIEQYVSPIIHENMDNRYELTHFFEIIKDITSNETVKQMKNFKQHCIWPVTFSFPKYKESYIVTVMDKYSACLEIYSYIKEKFKKGRLYKHAYTFLNAFLLK